MARGSLTKAALKFHPIADIFPLMEGEDFLGLVEDIRSRGLLEPIWRHRNGSILDGRNRYRACLEAGIEPAFRTFDGSDAEAIALVVSLNVKRRHLNESQRAMVAAKLANLSAGSTNGKGGGVSPIGETGVTEAQAAALLNVGKRSVERARKVQEHGTPELVAAVEQGSLAVSAAATMAKAEPETQRNLVAHVLAGNAPQEAIRKERASKAATVASLPESKYRVVYADPPWSYGNTQPDYHSEQRDHYPVMSLTAIADLPVRDMTEPDAVLFLWVTSPILEDSFSVIRAWGFTYKASFVWDKVKHNMGHYNSVRHEFLLVCVRGSCQPDERKLFDSVVCQERTEHSAKPEAFRQIIDTIYPIGKRVELFRRGPSVDGWDAWGNEHV